MKCDTTLCSFTLPVGWGGESFANCQPQSRAASSSSWWVYVYSFNNEFYNGLAMA